MRDTNKLTAYAKQMAQKAKETLLHKIYMKRLSELSIPRAQHNSRVR